MKRKLTTVEEFFKDDLDTPQLQKAYSRVLNAEHRKSLRSLAKTKGLSQEQLSQTEDQQGNDTSSPGPCTEG